MIAVVSSLKERADSVIPVVVEPCDYHKCDEGSIWPGMVRDMMDTSWKYGVVFLRRCGKMCYSSNSCCWVGNGVDVLMLEGVLVPLDIVGVSNGRKT